MTEPVVALGWIGIFASMALGAVGSIVGCSLAGQAAIGAKDKPEVFCLLLGPAAIVEGFAVFVFALVQVGGIPA
jgi:hypothetical protein